MVVVFLIMIWVFTIFMSVYLYKNDFAAETIEIVFPAIGAILFSAFLGYKAIFIDPPKIHSQSTPVALLVDLSTGSLTSMVRPMVRDRIEKMNQFSGLHEINNLFLYDIFRPLNLFQDLSAESTNELDKVIERELDILEYSLFNWLGKLEQFYAFQPAPIIYGTSGISGGGSVSGIDLSNIPNTSVEMLGAENPLQNVRPITFKLPSKSKVTRTAFVGVRTLEIVTHHSTIIFRISLRQGGLFQMDIDSVSRKISEIMNIKTTNSTSSKFWNNVFLVEISANQKATSRFSKQSKIENKWIKNVKLAYDENFSWTRLRDSYAN